MRKTVAAFLVILLCYTSGLFAQNKSPFQRPGAGPERAKLAFLAGSFNTETHLSASRTSPNGSVGKGSSSITWAVDSMYLLLDDQSLDQAMGQYRAHGVLGYNAREGKYTLAMFNNFGDTPRYTGSFIGDTLVMTSKVEFPGGSFDQKLVWFKDGKNLRLKIYNDMGKGAMMAIDQIQTPVAVK